MAALLYVGVAVVFTHPLLSVAGSHIAYKPSGDQLFILSILEWNRSALFARPGDFFEGNFYYGSGGALFGSDLLLGFLPIYGPLALLSQSPVLAYSLTHILSFALNASAMYAAVLVLTGSRPAALLAGTAYAFAPLQLAYASHFQFLGAWYLPLVLLFGIRLWRGGGWLDFGLATLMVWTQFATAVHLGVIAAMVYAAFVIPPAAYRVAVQRDARLGIAMAGAGIVASLPFVPIVHGYLSFADAWRANRDITEVQNFAPQLRDYLSPNGRLQWHDALMNRFPVPTGEWRIFAGFVPPALAALGAGADALTLINTIFGMSIDPATAQPTLGNGGGGLSGPAIRPVAVRAIYDVREALGDVPIVGVGGVAKGEHAVELMAAGACAVQVGTASFWDPRAPASVLNELRRWCERHGIGAAAELTGRAHRSVDERTS